MAQTSTEINPYCFDRSVNLREVHRSLKFLLLPKDIVEFRIEENCLDIVTSPERGKLFEKYLAKRYDLKKDTSTAGRISEVENENVTNKGFDCHLDLKTTRKSKVETSNFKMGEKNILNKGETVSSSVSRMELLLGAGKSGELSVGEESLKVSCQLIGIDSANLIFSYTEKNKASVNTEVLVKKGEWLNIASVLKELNDKTKTLGIPQAEVSHATGKIETIYELQFK